MWLLLACCRQPRHIKYRLPYKPESACLTRQLTACHWLSLSHILPTSSRRTCSSFCTSLVCSEFPSLSSLSAVGGPLMGLCMRSNATSMACMTELISTSFNMPELQGLICAHTFDMQDGTVHLGTWRMPHMSHAAVGVINLLSHLQQPDRSRPEQLSFQVLLQESDKHNPDCVPATAA